VELNRCAELRSRGVHLAEAPLLAGKQLLDARLPGLVLQLFKDVDSQTSQLDVPVCDLVVA